MMADVLYDGMRERPQTGFSYENVIAFDELMRVLYDNRCAITGRSFDRDEMDVFLFQPLEHGGRIEPGNAILVEAASCALLQAGILQINDQYEVFVSREDLRQQLGAEGISTLPISLPDDIGLWPTQDMLAYHRSLYCAQ